MKAFKGPRHQRGWIGLAIGAASAIYGAYSKNKDQEQQQENTADTTNQKFQDQAWLADQQRQFQLQDRQYKENAINQYSKFYNGPAVAPPKLTDPSQLTNWQPNAKGGDIPILNSSYPYLGQGTGTNG